MDSTKPTPRISFDPLAAWESARQRNRLAAIERRKVQEARKLAAMLRPEDTRPTIPAPAR